jgi:hypothetical protein
MCSIKSMEKDEMSNPETIEIKNLLTWRALIVGTILTVLTSLIGTIALGRAISTAAGLALTDRMVLVFSKKSFKR